MNTLVISGGEDCRYKIWDMFGRQLYASAPFDTAVTAVKWAPSGSYFAVGAFDTLRLCDRSGWSHAREAPSTGSIFDIAWTSDGTQLAAAGGNGAVCFAYVLDRCAAPSPSHWRPAPTPHHAPSTDRPHSHARREVSWGSFEVHLAEATKIRVHDVLAEGVEELEFRDRVIEMGMAFGYLVVATAAQCIIHAVPNWHTPHIFDLREPVTMLKLAPKHFAVVDNLSGVQIYSYEGRPITQLKFPGFRPEFASHQSLALSADAAAWVDRAQPKVVRFLDCVSGKAPCKDFTHTLDVDEIVLSQVGHGVDRKLALIDRNRDLHMVPIADDGEPVKLATMVDSALWNDDHDMLLAVADAKLLVYYFPQAAYTDRDLLAKTLWTQDASHLGKLPSAVSFNGTRATIRRSDGALVHLALPPYPAKLASFCNAGEWEAALRLCRYVRDPTLWACLAAMAVDGRDYNAAEAAYAAIEEVDKLKYMLHIKDLPTEVRAHALRAPPPPPGV